MSMIITGEKNGQKITVTVDGGSTEVEVSGVKGSGCHAVSEAIERSLGKTSGTKPTAEMYQPAGAGTVRA